jgi:hypothetical protein
MDAMSKPNLCARARNVTGLLLLALFAGCGGGSSSDSDGGEPTYAVGGSVNGLAGSGLVLQLNGGTDLTINESGAYAFPALADGSDYAVTVKTQPTGTPAQTCIVTNGSGTLNGADAVNIDVTCSPWTKQIGGGGFTEVYRSATDAEGNLYVAGYTDLPLDGNPAVGVEDAFLIKYDRYGKRLYTRQWGATGAYVNAAGVAVDGNGNVYVTGETDRGLDGHTLVGASDAYLIKFDPAGNRRTWQWGAVGDDIYIAGMAIDGSGNVYVAGATRGGVDGNNWSGGNDVFLSKFDPAGNRTTQQWGQAGKLTLPFAVAADGDGNAWVVGYTNGEFDGNTLTGSYDAFLTRSDAAGNRTTWQWGAPGAVIYASGVAVHGGNVYVAGNTDSGLDGNPMTGNSDVFMAKFDAAGNRSIWEWGAANGFTFAYNIAVDAGGNVYVTGNTNNGLDGNTPVGFYDSFLTKYDPQGNRQSWQWSAGPGAYSQGNTVGVDGDGNVYVAGTTDGPLDGNVQSAPGALDSYIVKYDTAGNRQ